MIPDLVRITPLARWRRSSWIRLSGLALLLIACEPLIPGTGSCSDVPACSELDYRITAQGEDVMVDSAAGHFNVQGLDFAISIDPDLVTPIASNRCPNGRGMAFALSCAPCRSPALVIDSLTFGTDIFLETGDTLKAEEPVDMALPPVGFSGGWHHLRFNPGFQTRFRDSIFEVRFTGSADGVPKSGSATLHITNPALLMP